MQSGFLSIVTTVDGVESRFSCQADMELNALSAVLSYKQEDAEVVVRVFSGGIVVERKGDYGLRLDLREGERTKGTLSIAGNEGEIDVYTEKAAYSISKSHLLVQLQYSLYFGQEKQDMRLRLSASLS